MNLSIKIAATPEELCDDWDVRADSYYLTKSFLRHLQTYNPCNQRYYELYEDDKFVAGTIAYTLKVNLFTFSKLSLAVQMQVIGIPLSIASVPFTGDPGQLNYLLSKILEVEKGLVLGLNFPKDYCSEKVTNMRMLPTIVMNTHFADYNSYLNKLRYPYRRRSNNHEKKFKEVKSIESSCFEFGPDHHKLYLEIMKKSKTKLEVLSLEFFKNLPDNFILTTHYIKTTMLAWQVCTKDKEKLYFMFGGMDYTYRDSYNSYFNNLLSVLKYAIRNNYSEVDFGQTSELAKLRLGGYLSERRMFIYHRNKLLNTIFYILKPIIQYKGGDKVTNVFKFDK
jgi:hypothetical protein